MKTAEDEIVRIAKALSDRTRVRILCEVSKRKHMTCGETETLAGLAQPTVSHHLKILTESGLLDMEKDGRHAIFTVNHGVLDAFIHLLGRSTHTQGRNT